MAACSEKMGACVTVISAFLHEAGEGTRSEKAGFVLAHLISMPDQVHLQVARVPLEEAEPVALEISRGFVAALARSQANGSF